MPCDAVQATEVVERYLTGQLAEDERERFEEHYFACDSCFATLQTLRATREAVRSAGDPAVLPLRRRLTVWAWTAAAAAVALVVTGALLLRTAPPKPEIAKTPAAPHTASTPRLDLLARIEPPAYTDRVLRGTAGSAGRRFRAAMEFYRSGQYARVIEGLRDVDSLDARYYRGISYLLIGQAEEGAAELSSVIAAGDASPYLEEARYYRAKARLKVGNLSEARAELEAVAGMRGDLQRKAQEIVDQLTMQ